MGGRIRYSSDSECKLAHTDCMTQVTIMHKPPLKHITHCTATCMAL